MDARITSVVEREAGSELDVAVSAGATTLTVVDSYDFDADVGGTLTLDDGTNAETVAYTFDEDSDEITVPALANAYAAETPVTIPDAPERWASVVEPEGDEELEARIPHALYDRIPLDQDYLADEMVVEVAYLDDELVVEDVLVRAPTVDASFIEPGTFTEPPSDGVPPETSPAPTLTPKLRGVFATWDGAVNNDPVTYEVHVAVSNASPPDATTLLAEIRGTMAVVEKLPDGTLLDVTDADNDGLADDPVYVALVAKDEDGAAAPSAWVEGHPSLVAAELIVADTAMFEKLNALLILANTLATGTSGARWEADVDGMRLYDSADNLLVNLPTDGSDPSFEGFIRAFGAELPAAPSTWTSGDERPEIRWLGTLDASVDDDALLALRGQSSSSGASTGMQLKVRLRDGVGNESTYTIIGTGGISDFVRNPANVTPNRKLNRGTVAVSGGASPFADSAAITHDLTDSAGAAVAPTAIAANVISDTGQGSQHMVVTARAVGTTTFVLRVYRSDGTNIGAGTVTVGWMAMT